MKLTILTVFFTMMAGLPFADHWNPDTTKAKIAFSVKGPFGTVQGSFSGLKADLEFNAHDPAKSSLSASIEAKTVSTGISLRNRDLRKKEEWLNTDKYPKISFKSKKMEKTADGFKVTGNLTLKATIKPVEIPFTFTETGNNGLFKGRFTINREDYDVGKKGGSVGNTITIDLEVPVKK